MSDFDHVKRERIRVANAQPLLCDWCNGPIKGPYLILHEAAMAFCAEPCRNRQVLSVEYCEALLAKQEADDASL